MYLHLFNNLFNKFLNKNFLFNGIGFIVIFYCSELYSMPVNTAFSTVLGAACNGVLPNFSAVIAQLMYDSVFFEFKAVSFLK